jgi:hypothetical protein
VEINRRLTAADPAEYEPDLAMTLNGLGCSLSAAGHHPAALTASTEALGLYRRLAAADPISFDEYVADALNDHATIRSRLDQHAEAAAASAEAVPLHRRLAEANPGKYDPELARALATFAEVRLAGRSALPQPATEQEAVAAAQEAVTRYEQLAAALPGAFDTALQSSTA